MHRGRVKYCLNKACWGTAVKLVKNYIICYPDFPSKRQTLARLITEIKNNGPCTLTVHISHRTVCASVEYFASACDWVTAVCLLRASEPVFTPRGAARQKELSFCPPRTLILCSSTYVLTPVCACCFSFPPRPHAYVHWKYEWKRGTISELFSPLHSVDQLAPLLCYVCLVRDSLRTSNIWGAAGVLSSTPRQVCALLETFQRILVIPEHGEEWVYKLLQRAWFWRLQFL